MSSVPDFEEVPRRPTFAEIDLNAYARNLEVFRRALPAGSKLIAVLKANGYGHGAIQLARECEQSGTAMLAVAMLEEALELRQAGISLPILILGALTTDQVPVAVEKGFVQGIVGPEQLRDACALARADSASFPIHLKLDTGMGRVGLVEADLPEAITLLSGAKGVKVEGIYTHLSAASDPGHPLTSAQLERFRTMLATLEEGGIAAPLHHIANSAAVVQGLVEPGDFVRAGMILLGGETLDRGDNRLEPVLQWTTRIIRLKEVPSGSFVGYGASFQTKRTSLIATLPVGYADGYNRLLSNRGEVLIRGRRAPVAGRVSMDLVSVDVTDIPDVAVDDPVVLLGIQGGERMAAEEFAEKIGTIPYEVVCAISSRVPRIYLK